MITEGINTDSKHQIYTHSLRPESYADTQKATFLEIFNSTAKDYVKDNRPCEYFDLADSTGHIGYKGAIYYCNKESNRLELGNVSDESKCIRIKLSKGGSLLVNRENIDQLLMSISMFSAKDQGLIMQAVMKDRIATEAKKKAETQENTKDLLDIFSSDDRSKINL